MSDVRKAIVAGQFYPSDKAVLESQVKNFLSKDKKENVKAGIVPHAGYVFSGSLAGKVIGKIKKKKNFIIIGVNHSGIGGKLSFSAKNFETPLGIVKNNQKIGEKILEKLKKEIDVSINEQAHQFEHSIEIELPFLQISQKKFSIVPILPKNLNYVDCKKTAGILSEFIREDTCLIVSSDFTHYGFNYGFIPFTENVKENLYNLDKDIIDEILALNSRRVYEKAGKSTVCGVLGLTILTEIAKIKKWKAKLIGYYTSGDVLGDWGNAVGYAGIVFT